MLRYKLTGRKYSAVFLDPNQGGGSGASGDASGQPNNNSGGDEPAVLDPKLFDQIPMDELDDESRKVIERIKTSAIATSQQIQTLRSQHENAENRARSFQAETDRVKAELQKLNPQRQQQQEGDPILKAVEQNLRDSGVGDAEIKKLAPMFVGMFKSVHGIQREALGQDLRPLVGSVLSNQAINAFQQAQANDPMEMLKVPEVANEVWATIKQRAEDGKETTPEIVLNFAKMAYVDHQLKTKQNGGQQQSNQSGVLPSSPPSMNTGGFPFVTGSAIRSIAPAPTDGNAPRTTLNEDTREAVATSVKHMLKGFEGKIKMPKSLETEVGGRRR